LELNLIDVIQALVVGAATAIGGYAGRFAISYTKREIARLLKKRRERKAEQGRLAEAKQKGYQRETSLTD